MLQIISIKIYQSLVINQRYISTMILWIQHLQQDDAKNWSTIFSGLILVSSGVRVLQGIRKETII